MYKQFGGDPRLAETGGWIGPNLPATKDREQGEARRAAGHPGFEIRRCG